MPRKKEIFLSKKNQNALDEFLTHKKAQGMKNPISLDNYKYSIQINLLKT